MHLPSSEKDKSEHLNNIESVIGIALMNIPDRSDSYDAVSKILGVSRAIAKKLCLMYQFRAGNSALRKAMIEEDQAENNTAYIMHNASGNISLRLNNARVSRLGDIITVKGRDGSFTGSSQQYSVSIQKNSSLPDK
jgi:ribosomal protein S13